MRSKSDETKPLDNLLCENAEVEAVSILDVLRLRGGGKDDSSSDAEASMGMGESQTDDDESGIVTHSWV